MKLKAIFALVVAFALCSAGTTMAAGGTSVPAKPKALGDPAAGKAKAALCVACHGTDGNSTNPEWPKIAGQHAWYTAKQLRDLKAQESRSNAVMTGIVAALSDDDMNNLAAYFATQSSTGAFITEEQRTAGERIYRGGNHDTKVPACAGCHAINGAGDPNGGFPSLAGQHAKYIVMQLNAFRNQTRSNDRNAMMRDIAARMTPQEMQAVADYISALH